MAAHFCLSAAQASKATDQRNKAATFGERPRASNDIAPPQSRCVESKGMSTSKFSSSAASGAPQALAHYGVIELPNGLVLLPGQGCRDAVSNQCAGITRKPDGSIERYDIRAQAEGVFRNVEALLSAAGLSRRNIIDVTVFMKNKTDFAAMNEVWNAFFKESSAPPARTTVFVLDLPGENFIEMKVLAFRGTEAVP